MPARPWLCLRLVALFRGLVVHCDCRPCFASLTHLFGRVPNDGHPSLAEVALNCSWEDQEDLDAGLDPHRGRRAGLADLGSHLAHLAGETEGIFLQGNLQAVGTAFLEADLEEADRSVEMEGTACLGHRAEEVHQVLDPGSCQREEEAFLEDLRLC